MVPVVTIPPLWEAVAGDTFTLAKVTSSRNFRRQA
jgi:hypothetical protein